MTTATLPEATTQVDPRGRRKLSEAVSPLYVADDVAALLQCSVRNIWAMNDRGELPGMVRIGRLVRWRKSAVDAWIENGCKPAE